MFLRLTVYINAPMLHRYGILLAFKTQERCMYVFTFAVHMHVFTFVITIFNELAILAKASSILSKINISISHFLSILSIIKKKSRMLKLISLFLWIHANYQ